MARNSSSSLLRSLLLLSRNNKPFSSFSSIKTLTTTSTTQISSSSSATTTTCGYLLNHQMKPLSSFASTCVPLFSSLYFSSASRSFSSSSSSSSASNFVLIKSEQEFNSSLKKARDDSLPSIFYFTAVWCGPCKLMSPIIEDLSKKYPHVTTYKVDIDQEEIHKKLSELNIMSVPTIHFFQNGKKTDEMVGADVARLNQTVERLYSTKSN